MIGKQDRWQEDLFVAGPLSDLGRKGDAARFDKDKWLRLGYAAVHDPDQKRVASRFCSRSS